MNETFEKTKNALDSFMNEILESGQISPASLELIHKAVCIIGKIQCIEMADKYFCHNYGRSAKDKIIDKLEEMIEENPSKYERHILEEWIEKLLEGKMKNAE